MLRRLLLILVIFSLVALPVASADDGGHNPETPVENELHFTNYPQIYINPSANTSFNLSYEGLLLFTNYGLYYAYFPSQTWVVHRVSNNSLYYTSNLVFHKTDASYLRDIEKKFNVSSNVVNGDHENYRFELESRVTSEVTIWMNKTLTPNPLPNNNTPVSSFQLTFSMNSNSITGQGDLLLIQQLGAKLGNIFEQYHHLSRFSQNFTKLNTSGISVTSTNYSAYYWWNSSFVVNGLTSQLNASKSSDGNVDTLIFQFHFTNGIHTLTQDPHFSVPSIDLFQSPILQNDIQQAANFLIIHSELLAGGLATGMALLGVSYASFRRRK